MPQTSLSIFDQRECPAGCPCGCHVLFTLPLASQRRVCASCPSPRLARDPHPYAEPPPSAVENFRLLTRDLRQPAL